MHWFLFPSEKRVDKDHFEDDLSALLWIWDVGQDLFLTYTHQPGDLDLPIYCSHLSTLEEEELM